MFLYISQYIYIFPVARTAYLPILINNSCGFHQNLMSNFMKRGPNSQQNLKSHEISIKSHEVVRKAKIIF